MISDSGTHKKAVKTFHALANFQLALTFQNDEQNIYEIIRNQFARVELFEENLADIHRCEYELMVILDGECPFSFSVLRLLIAFYYALSADGLFELMTAQKLGS